MTFIECFTWIFHHQYPQFSLLCEVKERGGKSSEIDKQEIGTKLCSFFSSSLPSPLAAVNCWLMMKIRARLMISSRYLSAPSLRYRMMRCWIKFAFTFHLCWSIFIAKRNVFADYSSDSAISRWFFGMKLYALSLSFRALLTVLNLAKRKSCVFWGK